MDVGEEEYESDPEQSKLSLKMRRRQASDDKEEDDHARDRERKIYSRVSDCEFGGQGAAADYVDEESNLEEKLLDEVEEGEEEFEDNCGGSDAQHLESKDLVDGVVLRGSSGEQTEGNGSYVHGNVDQIDDNVSESVEGQAQEEKKEKKPFSVPTAGVFYMHDDRFRGSVDDRHRSTLNGRNLLESRDDRKWGHVTLHAYSNLTNVSPVVFLYLLKECYVYGTCKATAKFFALQHQVLQALHNVPKPGPAVFVAQCLSLLPIFESHCEGFSHLMIAALRRFLKKGTTHEDLHESKLLATQLFIIAVRGEKIYDDRILVKILEVFNIKLTDIKQVMLQNNDNFEDIAQVFIQQFISKLLQSQSYMSAVTLLEHLSIRHSGESFLHMMLENKEYRAAEKWAVFMGKQMICVLIKSYVDRKMIKQAYDLIKKNDLREEFPLVYQMGKESTLKKLAEKGCWDIAEMRAKSDRQLEFLVYLAMEAGYSEKVNELCEKYSLEGFMKAKEAEVSLPHIRYLHLDELAINNIVWVDEVVGLHDATCHIEGCKVVGLDCEWKPNYEKGSKPNKVSIMQIASEKMVFIIDLIKLSRDVPDLLDSCLIRIFHSPRILKLGYNFQCDMKQLSQSYKEFDCFKHFEMLLDIQNIYKEPRGGLSGLTKEVLGVGLNKTRRNSNWEERPLTQNQLEYAALDAAVLIRIFWHVRNQSQSVDVSNENNTQMEWKSHIISHVGDLTKTKKKDKSKKGCNV